MNIRDAVNNYCRWLAGCLGFFSNTYGLGIRGKNTTFDSSSYIQLIETIVNLVSYNNAI